MVTIRIARLARALLLAGTAALASAPVLADDLRDALVLAYNSNPTLQAARAQQRSIDENVPIARAAGLPSLSGTATYTEYLKTSSISFTSPGRGLNLNAQLGVPIYSGGSVKNSVRAADTRILAGRDDLRGVESGIFSQVVAAYMDVILAQEVVKLNRSNARQLEVNAQASRDRFEIGDVTRTDVAQSNSRLALVRGQVRNSQAQLIAARERYIQIVGKAPVDLLPPPPLVGLPAGTGEAVAYALDHNPDLAAAQQRATAAGFDVKVAGSSRLPRISIFAGSDYTNFLGSLGGSVPGGVPQVSTTAQAGVRASIPLFQGGLPAAQRRAAQARQDASMEQEIAVERAVVANVRSAYAQWQAAQSLIGSSQVAVDAASLSLEGVRAENSVGNRTILDILNAEQEALSAQVQLATARRNAYVAGFNLLAAMGKAEARDLGLDGGTLYDPQTNYDRVHRKIWDWSNDPDPVTESTRTVDTPAQDGSVTGD